MSETKQKVTECLMQITGKDEITEDMTFGKDIILTSINAMKLAFDLENALNIDSIPPETFYDIKTVAELIDTVENLK